MDSAEKLYNQQVQDIHDRMRTARTALAGIAPQIEQIAIDYDHDDMHRHLDTAEQALRDLYRVVDANGTF